jgi:hypothetical protein
MEGLEIHFKKKKDSHVFILSIYVHFLKRENKLLHINKD